MFTFLCHVANFFVCKVSINLCIMQDFSSFFFPQSSRHLLQGAADRLDVPEQEDDEYADADEKACNHHFLYHSKICYYCSLKIPLSHEFGCKGTAILANIRFKYFVPHGIFRNKSSFFSHYFRIFASKKRIKGIYDRIIRTEQLSGGR